ncbi:MAG: hypothetical protein IAC58_03500 [Firmicutes bacterium]|uniref:Uncharacterized protein n=1 Tax=Candidatus Onthovivens merdipullorum TaxID=2840889 RepID=A0A9D9GXJ0_9BACL|nr:hypothetical protein [Candidatus Onthovivens merdipullorum]
MYSRFLYFSCFNFAFAGLILRGLSVLISYFNKDGTDPKVNPKITLILKWKKLYEDEIINQEEYENKRVAILGIKKEIKEKKNNNNI